MQFVERQLKLIEMLILANESQINDIYGYFFSKESKVNLVDKKSNNNFRYYTGKVLAESEFIGLWQDKKINDSIEFANELRNNAQNRSL